MDQKAMIAGRDEERVKSALGRTIRDKPLIRDEVVGLIELRSVGSR